MSGDGSSLRGWALEQAPQGHGHGTEAAGVQEAFEHCSQTDDLIFGSSCVEPRVCSLCVPSNISVTNY